ncbi:hypothetical protein FB451DRAFT_1402803 [Mycena latifolia]|nr:hypothetical protein FB451DRAFT_1402803 [Mycena latifolia]
MSYAAAIHGGIFMVTTSAAMEAPTKRVTLLAPCEPLHLRRPSVLTAGWMAIKPFFSFDERRLAVHDVGHLSPALLERSALAAPHSL